MTGKASSGRLCEHGHHVPWGQRFCGICGAYVGENAKNVSKAIAGMGISQTARQTLAKFGLHLQSSVDGLRSWRLSRLGAVLATCALGAVVAGGIFLYSQRDVDVAYNLEVRFSTAGQQNFNPYEPCSAPLAEYQRKYLPENLPPIADAISGATVTLSDLDGNELGTKEIEGRTVKASEVPNSDAKDPVDKNCRWYFDFASVKRLKKYAIDIQLYNGHHMSGTVVPDDRHDHRHWVYQYFDWVPDSVLPEIPSAEGMSITKTSIEFLRSLRDQDCEAAKDLTLGKAETVECADLESLTTTLDGETVDFWVQSTEFYDSAVEVCANMSTSKTDIIVTFELGLSLEDGLWRVDPQRFETIPRDSC